MNSKVELLPIEYDGQVAGLPECLLDIAADVIKVTIGLYGAVGFHEPWIGYLALQNSNVVGACGFKSKPRSGRVEIAYFTFPEFEGKGVATAMAQALIEKSQNTNESPVLVAQTLPNRNASHRILEKLGFSHTDSIMDPKDGAVWEWQQV